MPRQIRNPRYAPEFLEKRLHPSAWAGSLTTSAYVRTAMMSDTTPTPPGNGEPVNTPPTVPPSGPNGPA